MTKTLSMLTTLAAAALLAGTPAFAAAKAGTHKHHCMKDGAEVAAKSRKQCKKDGGTWEKAAPADSAAPAASTPAS